MKKALTLMLMVAALAVLVQPAAAGERAGAFSISPFVGGYTFDGEQHLETAPVFGMRLGYDFTKVFGMEGVVDYLATKRTRGGERSINALSYRLDFLFNMMPDGPFVPYLAVGGGGITIGHGGNFDNSSGNELLYPGANGRNTAPTANAGLGFKYFMTDSVAFRGDARQLVVFGDKALYNWEYTAGLSFLFGGKTAAPVRAAEPAPVAAAPVAPAPQPAPVATLTATPASVTKGERATLMWTSNNATSCTIEPGIGAVKTEGTVTVTPAADTNYTLSCTGPGGSTTSACRVAVVAPAAPLEPKADLTVEPASVTRGEKVKLSWTSQNATKCDIQPGIGQVPPQGSMEVTPAADTAYTITCNGAGGTTDCTAKVAVVAPVAAPAPKPEELCVTLNIEFPTGKAGIPSRYRPDLEKIANFMKQYPDVKGVIEGHTDNKGPRAVNEKLSQRRAQSVKDYLVKEFGVEPSRLGVKGYGYTRPVADNATAEGRQKNRRIVANFDCVQK